MADIQKDFAAQLADRWSVQVLDPRRPGVRAAIEGAVREALAKAAEVSGADVAMMMEAAAARASSRPRIFFISSEALEWLRTGERGISSEVIFEHLTGLPIQRGRKDTPNDPDDLRRCRLLLKRVPDFALRLPEMAGVSERWAKLVKVWQRLGEIMDQETAVSNKCPRTWAAMSRLLYGSPPEHLKHMPDELAEVAP